MAGDDLDPNKMSRSDFLKPKENAAKATVKTTNNKNVKTRTKTPGKIVNKEVSTTINDDTDKLDKVIDLINAKDDKIVNAITEMTNPMRDMISNKDNKENMNTRKNKEDDKKGRTCQQRI